MNETLYIKSITTLESRRQMSEQEMWIRLLMKEKVLLILGDDHLLSWKECLGIYNTKKKKAKNRWVNLKVIFLYEKLLAMAIYSQPYNECSCRADTY